MKSILIITDDDQVRETVQSAMGSHFKVDFHSREESWLEAATRKRYDLLFIDVKYLNNGNHDKNGTGYARAINRVKEIFPSIQIIVMSSSSEIREAVYAVKAGASNYLTYPLSPEELKLITESTLDEIRVQSELDYLRDKFWEADSYEFIRTGSPVMRKTLAKIRSVAPTISTALLLGETGVGKGVAAHLIHRHSNRGERQFISVHCGALNDTLLESELFGHEKGAFTGAIRRKMGKFEIAHGGTIFLDEIGAVSPSMQIKLLKVLQEKTIERVGGEESIRVDVRIIAATNSDLLKMKEEGTFRGDLYYRLNVFPIEIPPLRERIEDIPLLVETFLNHLNKFYQKDITKVHPMVMDALCAYHWPGNIRELENLIERAFILETSHIIMPESIPRELFSNMPILHPETLDPSKTLEEVRRQAVEDIERQYLKKLLASCRGSIKQSAETAGVGVRQLHKLLSKYGIRKEDYKKGHSIPADRN